MHYIFIMDESKIKIKSVPNISESSDNILHCTGTFPKWCHTFSFATSPEW